MMKTIIYMTMAILFSLTELRSQTGQNKVDSIQLQTEGFLIDPFSDPSFPGGATAWHKHIRKTIKPIKAPCESGKVFLSFKVLASGKLDSIQVVRGLCEMADQNAIEILKTSGLWQPGTLKGKPIDSKLMVQIRYRYTKK